MASAVALSRTLATLAINFAGESFFRQLYRNQSEIFYKKILHAQILLKHHNLELLTNIRLLLREKIKKKP